MTRQDAEKHVRYRLDTAESDESQALLDKCTLVGWQCGFEPLFVAVYDYVLDCRPTEEDAEEIASGYLSEIGWFSDGATAPNFILA